MSVWDGLPSLEQIDIEIAELSERVRTLKALRKVVESQPRREERMVGEGQGEQL